VQRIRVRRIHSIKQYQFQLLFFFGNSFVTNVNVVADLLSGLFGCERTSQLRGASGTGMAIAYF